MKLEAVRAFEHQATSELHAVTTQKTVLSNLRLKSHNSNTKIALFWDVTPCSLVKQLTVVSQEHAASIFRVEMLVALYHTPLCYIPEDSNR